MERPEAIMINMPTAFLKEKGTRNFMRSYESMTEDPNRVFYHFIGNIPVHEVTHVYICFAGRVVYKVPIVQFLRKQIIDFISLERRHYMITCGPVVKAPRKISQKGFRGFRYTNHLF